MSPADVIDAEQMLTGEDQTRGERALSEGEVALVVLASGPEALLRIPKLGLSLLAWKLMQAGGMPVWVMTSGARLVEVHQHVSQLGVSPNLRGTVCEWPADSDVGAVLASEGILASNPQVKYAVYCDVGNVLGSPHAGILGHHIGHGHEVSCEVVSRDGSAYHYTSTQIVNVDVLQRTAERPVHFYAVPSEARYLMVRSEADLQSAGDVIAGYRFKP